MRRFLPGFLWDFVVRVVGGSVVYTVGVEEFLCSLVCWRLRWMTRQGRWQPGWMDSLEAETNNVAGIEATHPRLHTGPIKHMFSSNSDILELSPFELCLFILLLRTRK